MSETLDFAELTLREVNSRLHQAERGRFRIVNPRGAHALAVGISGEIDVQVEGSAGYFVAGMNQLASVTVHGNAGTGAGENIMSGSLRVTGSVTMSAGATGCGGLVVIEGSAGARCGISMKGVDIVVGGDIGQLGAFMAQAGSLAVLGDAGPHLGDSIYEAEVFVRGEAASLGADCVQTDMTHEAVERLAALLARAGMQADPADFRRYGSARELYSFHVDDIDAELAAEQSAQGGRGEQLVHQLLDEFRDLEAKLEALRRHRPSEGLRQRLRELREELQGAMAEAARLVRQAPEAEQDAAGGPAPTSGQAEPGKRDDP